MILQDSIQLKRIYLFHYLFIIVSIPSHAAISIILAFIILFNSIVYQLSSLLFQSTLLQLLKILYLSAKHQPQSIFYFILFYFIYISIFSLLSILFEDHIVQYILISCQSDATSTIGNILSIAIFSLKILSLIFYITDIGQEETCTRQDTTYIHRVELSSIFYFHA